MQVGDLVGFSNGDGPTGIIVGRWLEAQPGIGIEEQWCEVLWDNGTIDEHVEGALEKVNGSR
jgi:hypothetical protein